MLGRRMYPDSNSSSQKMYDRALASLPGGNTLITYSNDGLIHEIDGEGNVVLEIDGGSSSFGYSLWRETLYGPPPDISM